MSRNVVITGANRGLGLELVRRHASRGDVVIAGCRQPDAAVELRTLTDHVLELDVADESSVAAFGERVTKLVASGGLDRVVNNAGIDARNLGADERRRPVMDQAGEHIIGQVRVNAVGPLLVTRALSSLLAPGATVVNMSSQLGSMEVGARIGHDVGYAASKAALNMITVKLARHLRDSGVIAVAMHPGHLRTDMGGSDGAMAPEDAARRIVEVIDRLTIDDSGSFVRWDGTPHPW